ncbi:conserved Plasmodium protein, unknown function [Plasmodium sp. gorilla clade G3]|nr:conserved Plasmodium protein, unknown function [Plasmodium sp. gorilla clade G3]
MTKVNKPPVTINKIKKPNSKEEEEISQPVKKTLIAKNNTPTPVNKVIKKPEVGSSNTESQKKSDGTDDKSKKDGQGADKGKGTNADNKAKNNDDNKSNVQKYGYFSWLWKYFQPKKTEVKK